MDGHTPAEHFRDRLRRFREEKHGWTQAQLADQAKLSVVTISKLEQGKNLPTFEVLIALCSALSVTPNELVGWPMDASQPPTLLLSERLTASLKKLPEAHAIALIELAERLAKA